MKNTSVVTNQTKKLYQLVSIPDHRFENGCESINYGAIADDCDTKVVSLFEAINHISLNIMSSTEGDSVDPKEAHNLSCLIADLADIGIAINKISTSASYLSGVLDGKKKY